MHRRTLCRREIFSVVARLNERRHAFVDRRYVELTLNVKQN